ncbi:MAG: ShlB/FhaC/HecB family hemolysin secretion/activation protein [Leptolyngbyaceae cyanobacterium bins.302]|nr:ShlB/FhaC/HecB family hemolysin secretion/activation protein [Leptolyngbyaceae cyanobacterium bins.302]
MRSCVRWIVVGTSLVTIGWNGSSAQSVEIAQKLVPVVPPERPITLPTPTPQPSSSPDLLNPEVPAIPSPVLELAPSEGTVFVKAFRFEGNTVFTAEQLEVVTAPYANRKLTFTELLQARSAVTDFYVRAGYVTSGAYLPVEMNQFLDPDAAVFTIRVIEGKVEAIDIVGDRRLSRYVRSRLKQATEPVLNRFQLEEALRLLQIDPLIESVSANLSTGSQANLSVLTVQVKQVPPLNAQVQLNNGRSPTVGTLERGVQISAVNLLGQGDSFSVNYRNTDGTNGVDTDFTIPLSARNGTVSFRYSNLQSRIVESPFDQLDIQGSSRIYELSVRQPMIQRVHETYVEEFALGLTASRLESETTLLGIPFPLSAGADSEGKTRITALRFFQEYRRRSEKSVFIARSQLSFGLDALGSTINEASPDSRFLVWRGQMAWFQRVLGDSRLLVRTDLQLADRPLVPLEQFSLGGPSTVRGYRQDAIISENGFFSTVELQIPLLNTNRLRLDIVPFVDVGTTWNSGKSLNPDPRTLASTGLGLQFQHGGLLVRINYAIPFVDLDSERRSLQEQGFDFVLRYYWRF